MKNYLKSLLLLIFVIFSFSCSYMKTDLGNDSIEVKIIYLRGSDGKISGLKLAFNKIVAELEIQPEINNLKVKKLAFADVLKLSVLESITIPETVIEIDTFAGAGITNVELPDGLQKLPSFNGCAKLANITIPAKIKSIPDACFIGCEKLTTIKFESQIPPELENTKVSPFSSNNKNPLNIQVPEGCEEIYRSAWESTVDWKNITINGNL